MLDKDHCIVSVAGDVFCTVGQFKYPLRSHFRLGVAAMVDSICMFLAFIIWLLHILVPQLTDSYSVNTKIHF
jgi:hypothetical protein